MNQVDFDVNLCKAFVPKLFGQEETLNMMQATFFHTRLVMLPESLTVIDDPHEFPQYSIASVYLGL